jgi:NADH:ubiquinone oxidoreductase subunit 2 (subunit N)
VSLGYYGRVLKALYLEPSNSAPAQESGAETSSTSADSGVRNLILVIALVAVAVIALGLVPMFWGVGPLVSPFVPH